MEQEKVSNRRNKGGGHIVGTSEKRVHYCLIVNHSKNCCGETRQGVTRKGANSIGDVQGKVKRKTYTQKKEKKQVQTQSSEKKGKRDIRTSPNVLRNLWHGSKDSFQETTGFQKHKGGGCNIARRVWRRKFPTGSGRCMEINAMPASSVVLTKIRGEKGMENRREGPSSTFEPRIGKEP